ncbi:MAG: hypothetical protein V7752_19415, partial [Halopseudomonas sp.]
RCARTVTTARRQPVNAALGINSMSNMNIVMMLKNEKATVPECCCEDMAEALKDHEHPLYYSGAYQEFGLLLSSEFEHSVLNYCLWCGSKLPDSRRDEWFDKLEVMGIDPWEHDIPIHFLNSSWWSNA